MSMPQSREHLCRGADVAKTQSPPTILASSSRVRKIFEELTAKWPTGLSQVSQSEPHQEALLTKHKNSRTITTEHQTLFGAHTTSYAKFHVGSIAMVMCGLDTLSYSSNKLKVHGQLLYSDLLPQGSVDRRQYIQNLEDHGCYLQREILIDTTRSHEDIMKQQCTWFPKAFEYVDSQHECTNTSTAQPDWQLLVPNCGKLELSTAVHPNGIVLAHFKGCQKASIADSNLWFVTQNPVPKSTSRTWKVDADIVGTDVEVIADEGSHESSDEEVIELSSSIADLKIGLTAKTVNANAWPSRPPQSGGPISGPVAVNEIAAYGDESAPLPPNPWLTQFEEMTALKDGDVSDIDL
ncbi:hypothetical protein PISMIDRAFT_24555 [Pisolithus microcarpus 441]|uniref:Unplaced genomic scaffold scaffold_111, whole genome shotgun sequence n=1 Tax=Pisolithus microcarpus 441 TaxID=765257 RepID=A0A0C9YY81_9AGAM|nr:hypothetical protein PISMIDRAFT_24555 [Pisolithus microcarpus 441]